MDIGLDNLVTVATAIREIDAVAVVSLAESVSLLDADDRVLAEAIVTDRDYPPFDKALMDGYAVRSANVGGGSLRRVGEIAAGQSGGRTLGDGECVAIMTGAPLPPGADAVVPVERTTLTGEAVTIDGILRPGNAVARRAAEATTGDVVLPAGTRLGPAQLAVAAQVGAARVRVFARPRVGVLSSGDEVVPFDATPQGPQVRNGNSPMLAALVRRYGGTVVDLGHVRDDPAAIAAAIATPGLDALLVTGGMSMGVYDYTPRVLRDLGYELAVTKLKIKPGKPFVFAKQGLGASGLGLGEDVVPSALYQAPSPKPQVPVPPSLPPFVFGLPGNPVSAFVCTVRLVSRLLLRMTGASPEPAWTVATLGHDLPANGPREFYQPAVTDAGIATVPAWNGSADVFALARADALLVRGPGEAAVRRGDVVTLLRLP